MEENYKLEKQYRIPAGIFSKAYLEMQKKFVLPKSRLYMAVFSILAAAILLFGIFNFSNGTTKQKYCILLGFVLACAFAAREWYNPKKVRRNMTESVKSLGEPVYCIGIADRYVDISTVSDDLSDIPEEEREEAVDTDPLPEKTRINIDENFQLIEREEFFMLLKGSEMFYVLPKDGFSEAELEIVRDLKKRSA